MNIKAQGILNAARYVQEAYGPDTLRTMLREVARKKPDAITVMCTNLHGAPLVEEMERELGIPIYDSVATVLWKAMKLAGVDPSQVKGWGGLFA